MHILAADLPGPRFALGQDGGQCARRESRKALFAPAGPHLPELALGSCNPQERAADWSACSTRSGVMGMRVRRTPVARAIALATQAAGGTIGTSPTPRTP